MDEPIQSSAPSRPVLSGPVILSIFLLLAAGSYAALIGAPTEATMGLVQRIFYFHVASGWAFMAAYAVVFVGSVGFLRTRSPQWDWLAVSASEVGLAFNTVSLVTGSIWAKPVWGIWWTWDARLTSTFLLWILFVSYLVLRTLVIDPDRRGIVGSIRHLCVPGYSAGLFFDLVVSHAASAARNWRWRLAGFAHVLGADALLRDDVGAGSRADTRAVSARSVASRSGRHAHGGGRRVLAACQVVRGFVSTGALARAGLLIDGSGGHEEPELSGSRVCSDLGRILCVFVFRCSSRGSLAGRYPKIER